MKHLTTESTETAERNKRTDARRIRKLVNDARGAVGVVFGRGRAGAMHLAMHHGEGAAGGYCSITFTRDQWLSLLDKELRELPDTDEVPAIAQLRRDATCSLSHEIERLRGEEQVLRWRIMQLESDAARKISGYSDATALVPVPDRRSA
ncbi:MAG: hypothetical protein JNK23_10490 [Opitutaceae bacterium]|nr:hypothetical protein [Opitutaceae bacterium]